MTGGQITWGFGGTAPVVVGFDTRGAGETVLLLPSLSSISTRHEMDRLAESLSDSWQTVTLDWPGFGTGPKPEADWTPDLLSRFLDHVLATEVKAPYAIVAAGHAATYAMAHLAQHPGATTRLVSLAPTWRGPFPTMAGGQKGWFGGVRSAVDAPVVGPLLYALNMSKPVMNMMVRGHVYQDRDWLSGEALRLKEQVVDARGARFGSVRFVSGGLDRVQSREAFLALAAAAKVRHLVAYGARTPRRSRAEMEALGALDGVEVTVLPDGKLSFYEEFADQVAPVVRDFLARP